MKVVILSSFPPTKCGIGSYADQQAQTLRKQGHKVLCFNIHVLNQTGWRKADVRDLIEFVREADKLVIHYQRGLFYSEVGIPGLKSIVPYRAILPVLEESAYTEVIVHENYSPYLTPFVKTQKGLVERFFSKIDTAFLHTKHELHQFQIPVKSKEVLSPDAFYQKFTNKTKAQVRKEFGFRGPVKLFLASGFYHPGKGFERLVQTFLHLHESGELGENAHLLVITSDREGNFKNEISRLELLASDSPRVKVTNRYVSDEEFDEWIVASDFVVVPYTYGFTSSLLGRAKIHGRPAIVSALPALKQQATADDIIFEGDDDLAQIIKEVSK